MKIEISKDNIDATKSDVIITNYFKEEIKEKLLNHDLLKKLNEKVDGLIKSSLERKEMTGKFGNVVFIPSKEQSIILIGCGEKEEFTVEELKAFAAKGIREAKKRGFANIAFYARGLDDLKTKISYLTEGIYVGNYSFDLFKNKQEDDPKTVIESIKIITDHDNINLDQEMLHEGEIISASINFARDLINRPGNHCTPTILADEAKRFAKDSSLKISVYDKSDIDKMQMGSFLSVARGSDEPPKLIVMHHNPKNKKSNEKLALVGKGLTFDTGGISLKPSDKMHLMKSDMSGGAAVIGAMIAISKLDMGIEVLGIVPATENMPSGNAIKPGDIVRAMNGKTIEVLNTDAEGRLILADALCYAVKENATKIIDIATLTGACMVALGEITTGVLGNNQELIDSFINTCNAAGEKIWQLPLFKKYHEQIKSDVADMANIGGKYGGTITASAFLENFVDKTPWIHLDIAGTSWSSQDDYYSKGGTGVMVSSFVRYAKDLVAN